MAAEKKKNKHPKKQQQKAKPKEKKTKKQWFNFTALNVGILIFYRLSLSAA